MNNQQWQQIEGYAATDLNDDYVICLLELRDRVVALEGHQREAAMNELRAASAEARPAPFDEAENDRRFEQAKAIIDKPALATASSLVERVAGAIDDAPYDEDRHQWDEARAAIRAVAAWLRDRGFTWVAQTLELEANQ
jgi:hypothetical protein